MEWTIKSVYLGCAVLGGVVLLIQTVMTMTGGGDHDVGHAGDAPDLGAAGSGESPDHDTGFGLISIRSVASFFCFFGIVGMYGASAGWSATPTLAAATGAGVLMLLGVAWLFSMQRKLFSQGNVDPKNAVGCTARVYLRIPAAGAGKGKVTVAVQGRTVEYSASTKGAEIQTGSEVKLTRQITEDTFEVEPLT